MMTFQFNAAFPDATNEQKWDQIKLWRNAELARSDWTMHTDTPTDKVAWAKYRQELRDLPAQGGNADDATIPSAPSGE
jgi:hypothetical protein